MKSNPNELACIDCPIQPCDEYNQNCKVYGHLHRAGSVRPPAMPAPAERQDRGSAGAKTSPARIQPARNQPEPPRGGQTPRKPRKPPLSWDLTEENLTWIRKHAARNGDGVRITAKDQEDFARHGIPNKPARMGRNWYVRSNDRGVIDLLGGLPSLAHRSKGNYHWHLTPENIAWIQERASRNGNKLRISANDPAEFKANGIPLTPLKAGRKYYVLIVNQKIIAQIGELSSRLHRDQEMTLSGSSTSEIESTPGAAVFTLQQPGVSVDVVKAVLAGAGLNGMGYLEGGAMLYLCRYVKFSKPADLAVAAGLIRLMEDRDRLQKATTAGGIP